MSGGTGLRGSHDGRPLRSPRRRRRTAQAAVTSSADIQRLQDDVYQAVQICPGCGALTRPTASSAPGRARRAARRSDLPEGQAAQGRERSRSRVHQRARSACRRCARVRRGDIAATRVPIGAARGCRQSGSASGVPAEPRAARRVAFRCDPGTTRAHVHATAGSRQHGDPRRTGDRRPAADAAQLRHRAG